MLSCTSRAAHVVAAVALFVVPRTALSQDGAVGGVVLAVRSLRPVAGAQILAADTTLHTVTDADGRFRLAGVTGAEVRLTVRRIGFRPLAQTVRVGDTGLRLVLSEVAVGLNEVVVTGTTDATERRALGNAVTSISVPDIVERGSVSSVQQLLNGRAPGVTIQPGSGLVGAATAGPARS